MTGKTMSDDLVEVTQADRDAAAELIAAAPLVENPDIIRFGGADDGGFAQAFARHRIKAQADEREKTSKQGFRAVTPTSPEHAAVLSDLARRIDDE